MTSLALKNDIVGSVLDGINRFQASIKAVESNIDTWRRILEGTLTLNDTDQDDINLLLSFLAFQDESITHLRKMQGQLYFILSTEVMEKSSKALDKPASPKIVSLNKE